MLRDRRRPWGALVLFREAGAPDFSDADVRLVSTLASDFAAAVRRTLLLSEIAHRDLDDGPGMAVLRIDGEQVLVEMASSAALAMLAEVPDSRLGTSGLPVVVSTLATRLAAEGGRRQRSHPGCPW